MATFTPRKKPKPIEISQFLGINEAVGELQTKPGEWVKGFNFRTTINYAMQKRPGHHTFVNFTNTADVQGIWQGQISDKTILLICWQGKVYEYDLSQETETVDIADLITEGVVTEIGTITDLKTSIFWFKDNIYFLNGVDYKVYDGSTYGDVDPYVPTIAINAPPTGGGTLFEEVNLLTGEKKQTFVGDNSSTTFVLAEKDLLSIDSVTINGTPATSFTANIVDGQAENVVPTPPNEALVEIQWNKSDGNENLVKNHKYAIDFGVNNDTNLFLFGNSNEKNVFRYSAVGKANYFPANSFVQVGSTEFSITALTPNQQNLLVYKENSTFIVTPSDNPNFSDNPGLNPFNFGYRDLNEETGHLAPNQVQIVDDVPISLDGFSIYRWGITNVEAQRSAQRISDRLKLSLQVLNLRNAITFNYKNQTEYWLNVDNIVYIWNYGNDTMYKYDNIKATQFIEADEIIYYGSNGTVEIIKEEFEADGSVLGTEINAKVYGGMLDFEAVEFRKMMRDEWLVIEPDSRTSAKIKFITDRINEEQAKWYEVEYKLLDFNDIDFDDFSFLTNRQAQVNRIKGKVKKFVYLQWVIENNSNNESLTVLKLLMQCQTSGYSR